MQSIFKRYETKYLVTEAQAAALRRMMSQYMAPDQYGAYLVQNLYYDTARWDVIQASLEKPAYKEKMRLRCYGEAGRDSTMFLELKKKFKGVVYKRRIAIPARALANRSVRAIVSETPEQIARELDFYLQSNGVAERIYISYQRKAFAGIDDEELRVTFDTDIRFRVDDVRLANPGGGQCVLPEGKMLMEVKALGAMPLWLAGALSAHGVFPTTFSKFGVCYTNYIHKQLCEERKVSICA